MSKMKVAVIGCGTIAEMRHLPAYAGNALADIRYVADIRKERADEMAKQFDVPRATTDYRDILADEEVQAVSVCTPNDTHAPIAIDCLNAGKHVLCEKPAAMTVEQVREMKAAADRNGRILNIGVVNRFNSGINHVKRAIDDGELGELYHIYCSFRSHRSIPGLGGPFTTKIKSGGGILIDWGVHFLDLILYMIGQPRILTVSGATHSRLGKRMEEYAYVKMWAGPPDYAGTYDVEDFVTGLIRTDGPTLSLNGAWAQNIGESAMFVELLGDRAGIKMEYNGDHKLYTSRNGVLYETTATFAKEDMFNAEIDSFLRSAGAMVKNRANIDRVLATSEVIAAIYRSADEGREIALEGSGMETAEGGEER